jgi:DNA (cytosine-5)-methyltransferase 1
MKLGGLFSGIGGFELAWTRLGGEVAWMCEWDKNARKVLEARFPGVPIYPDVRDLDPAEVEAVDVLTGGSPCQGFSVAGKRTGLEHGESQLFADYIRIMDGLAERGLKWALWENVPGVLSIEDEDGNRTFEHVVAALAGGTEPVRLEPERRWNTGLASGRGRAVAWRVLDSRFFGVAQRRRRIFACVAFGGACEDRAGRALLAVAEGVSGDSAEGFEAGQGAAGSVEDRVGVPSVTGTLSAGAHPGSYNGQDAFNDLLFPDKPAYGMFGSSNQEGAMVETQPAITASHGQPGNVGVPAMLMTMREGKPGGGKGPLLVEEESLTLATGNGQTLFQPQAFRKSARAQSSDDAETWVDDGVANTVNTFDVGDARTTHAIVEPFCVQGSVEGRSDGAGPGGRGWKQGESFTLNTADRHAVTDTTHAIVEPVNSLTPWPEMGEAMRVYGEDGAGPSLKQHSPNVMTEWTADHTGTLQSRTYKGLNHENVRDGQAVVQTYGVRRLTPVECERLQAFPDGWTEPAGSDSARYKALGNAVTVNTVGWILRRMKAQG